MLGSVPVGSVRVDVLGPVRLTRDGSPVAAGLGDGLPALAPLAARPRLSALHERLGEALALWRGTPYPELGESEPVRAERDRLEELRLVAIEDAATLALALGRHAEVAAAL